MQFSAKPSAKIQEISPLSSLFLNFFKLPHPPRNRRLPRVKISFATIGCTQNHRKNPFSPPLRSRHSHSDPITPPPNPAHAPPANPPHRPRTTLPHANPPHRPRTPQSAKAPLLHPIPHLSSPYTLSHLPPLLAATLHASATAPYPVSRPQIHRSNATPQSAKATPPSHLPLLLAATLHASHKHVSLPRTTIPHLQRRTHDSPPHPAHLHRTLSRFTPAPHLHNAPTSNASPMTRLRIPYAHRAPRTATEPSPVSRPRRTYTTHPHFTTLSQIVQQIVSAFS